MPAKAAVVATTIGDGQFVPLLANAAIEEGVAERVRIVVIPDINTPASVGELCAAARRLGVDVRCPSVPEQDTFLERLGRIRALIPYRSDNRRNVGFLMALADGDCDTVISLDDDNFPVPGEGFFREHLIVNHPVQIPAVHADGGWFNAYDLMEIRPGSVFARGFPYRHRQKAGPPNRRREEGIVHVNMGMCLGHPDVDAVTCLNGTATAVAFGRESVLLGRDTWSPINTQNTAVSRQAMTAYYFVRLGHRVLGVPMDRYSDIFSGYFVQACARHLGFRIRVGSPIVDHRRNSHEYLKDLTQELACILILEDLADWLRAARLEGRSYAEAYLSLAFLLEDAVEQFRGMIWTEVTRAFFHDLAQSMRTWVQTVEMLG